MFVDTICAPATGLVHSSIAVIRVSGPETLRAVSAIFSRPEKLEPRTAAYGSIRDAGEIVDDVIAIYFKAPASFTGEDMAEISCHGNPVIVNRILALLIRHGARIAGPGEFSKRAFLHGKIDLTAAEAINHIVKARGDWEIQAAIRQMHGSLKNLVAKIRNELIGLKADIECGIDFSEEGIEFISGEQAIQKVEELITGIEDMMRRCRIGGRLSGGIDVPIVGKPNVGKSSILNLLLNAERAIVSNLPGTTRDMIRESVRIAGIEINLFDTAGIDTTECAIELKGIEFSRRKIESSPLIIIVLDATTGIRDADRAIMEHAAGKRTIYLVNKTDLAGEEESARIIASLDVPEAIAFSACTGAGLAAFENMISSLLLDEFADTRDAFVADTRIIALLESALVKARGTIDLLVHSEPPEIIAFSIQEILDEMGEITGEISPDEVLNSIFSRFCIGK
ncbi:MAG: tRNA uridine-5-carboxymethylaminomethyl(34) synthesis GTPase MnmE [Spirochaetes bacterium]|nr:MAG: tRNA uridine-5-carboxymethylaminomethyl(34) synthesis GTPase MnmE [Spirochaetota bacterium]